RARGCARARPGSRVRSGVRRPAAIEPPQIGAGDALSPHQSPALGQAARRGRPYRDARAVARTNRGARPRLAGSRRGWAWYNRPIGMSEQREPMANNVMTRFFGGPPAMVLVRLILLSILIGVVLSSLGFDPWNIIPSIKRFVLSIWDMGFDAVRWL